MNRRELIIASTLLATQPHLALGQTENREDSTPTQRTDTPPAILLSDYLPQSIYRIPITEVPKAKYPIFDGHNHGHGELSVTEMIRIMDKVGVEKSVIFTGAGTIERFREIAREYAGHADRFDLWCMFDLRGIDESGFGPNAIRSLEECCRAGAKGIGELHDKGRGIFSGQNAGEPTPAQKPVLQMPLNGGPEYTRVPVPPNPNAPIGPHPDDPRLDPLWDKAGELGMPISFHTADPIWSYKPMDHTNDGLMNGWT